MRHLASIVGEQLGGAMTSRIFDVGEFLVMSWGFFR